MERYDWSCHVCHASNAAASTNCAACGFPARARGSEIIEAQNAAAPREQSNWWTDFGLDWPAMSRMQKTFAALMILLALVGVLMTKLAVSTLGTVGGVVIFCLAWLLHVLLPKAHRSEGGKNRDVRAA